MERLAELGRTHRPGDRLPDDVPDDLKDMVCVLYDACAASLDTFRRFLEDGRVLRCPRLTTVFTQYPLDVLLFKLSTRSDVLRTRTDWHDLLYAIASSEGVDLRRFACGLVPVVFRAMCVRDDTPPLAEQCLDLLLLIAAIDAELVRDRDLFRTVGSWVATESRAVRARVVALLVGRGSFVEEVVLAEDVFVALVRRVVHNRGLEEEDAVHLETLVARNAALRSGRYARETVQLWKTEWGAHLGRLVALLLDTPCVCFVVYLDRIRQLTPLVHRAATHTAPHWDLVRARLRAAYPARVDEILDARDVHTPATEATCPITLAPMAFPVVASDGHTYERDALLAHLVRNGFVSPLTRAALLGEVYPNYALHSA